MTEPDAAALIQRAEYMLSKDSGFFIGGEWRALVSDLLVLLTARETAIQESQIELDMSDDALIEARRELGEDDKPFLDDAVAALKSQVAALEAALATAQQERDAARQVGSEVARACDKAADERDALRAQVAHLQQPD